ncbi:MAG TPA: DUF3052 domain-containing protein [Reyranella sp.]|jgi:hypothetical protein
MSPVASSTGYSGTPLAQKLGLRDGQRVMFIGLPKELGELRRAREFGEVAEARWENFADGEGGYDVIHGFTTSRQVLEGAARPLMDEIDRDGAIWISWPKKASKVPTDITEDVIRELVLPIGLVDVKVAAVTEIWSGLKLVIRKELR